MTEEITTKKVEDLGEAAEPLDADVFLHGSGGGNVIKKIRWGNLIKKLRTLLFVNNRTTTEEGFGLDARQGKLIQDELDQLNTKIVWNPLHPEQICLCEKAAWWRKGRFQTTLPD